MPERDGHRRRRVTAPMDVAARLRVRKGLDARALQRTRRWLAEPSSLWILLIVFGFVVLSSVVIGLVRGVDLIAPGRVMDETRLVRVPFEVPDRAATQSLREIARRSTPDVYTQRTDVLDSIERALTNIVDVVGQLGSFDDASEGLIESVELDERAFTALREIANDEVRRAAWIESVDRLGEQLRQTPLVPDRLYQSLLSGGGRIDVARIEGARFDRRGVTQLLPIGDASSWAQRVVRDAGFEVVVQPTVAAFLRSWDEESVVRDVARSEQAREAAASAVPMEVVVYEPGEVLYARGEQLSERQYSLANAERAAVIAERSIWTRVLRGIGIAGAVVVITLVIGGYVGLFYPSLLKEPLRLCAVAGLTVLALALSCGWAASSPQLVAIAVTVPTLLLVVTTLVAYDRRLALVIGVVQTVMVGIALMLPMTWMVSGAVGIGLVVWTLHEIRSRFDIVRATVTVAVGMLLVSLLAGLIERPLVGEVWSELLVDSSWAGAGGFVAGALAMVLLPLIERAFDVETGITLSELRDPRHPLLRELQQRAPGTYNHSLNVASIAEAAADAIGADSFHVYVGALYHDCGKMNKPEYFVENQIGASSKHTKLSPAMSLLVIVGHVKDGVELAKAARLPQSLRHYIESHHGTTVVEYFYEQAKRQADADDDIDRPAESEYRYPGPRPRTKEAAILMLCDAVESATRVLSEPTSSRIATLVRKLSQRRLDDGQFDDSLLTMREITKIEDAITKSLTSIYHGRISYPSGEEQGKREKGKADEAPIEGSQVDAEVQVAAAGSGEGGTHDGDSARPASA